MSMVVTPDEASRVGTVPTRPREIGRWKWKVGHLIVRDGPLCAWCGVNLARATPGPWELVGGATQEELDQMRTTQGVTTLEHVIPKSRGGTVEFWNLILSCRRCNFLRGVTPAVLFHDWCLAMGFAVQTRIIETAIARIYTFADCGPIDRGWQWAEGGPFHA